MAYCKVSKAEIYYEDIGEGIPIIMIHGFSPDHRLMKGCMEPVFKKKHGFRRIYIDLPGMGLTKNYEAITCSDEMLEAVIEFIQQILPDQKYAIAGESYGGYITRGVIHQQGNQILGAALICPVIKPLTKDRIIEKHRIARIDENFIATLSHDQIEDFKSNHVILDEYNWIRYQHEILSGVNIANTQLLEKVQNNYSFSFKVDQSEFLQPSVFLLGKQDSVVGYKDALNIQGLYPKGAFAVLEHAGHNLQIEQPRLFSAFIDEWLDRILENI